MSYSTAKLLTIEECNKAIALANTKKEDLIFEQTVSGRQLTGQEKSTALSNASLLSTKAEITGTEAAIEAMPDGEAKNNLISKLRRLNDRKDNLEERIQKGGSAALLDAELDAALLVAQIAEVDAYITAVEERKAAI